MKNNAETRGELILSSVYRLMPPLKKIKAEITATSEWWKLPFLSCKNSHWGRIEVLPPILRPGLPALSFGGCQAPGPCLHSRQFWGGGGNHFPAEAGPGPCPRHVSWVPFARIRSQELRQLPGRPRQGPRAFMPPVRTGGSAVKHWGGNYAGRSVVHLPQTHTLSSVHRSHQWRMVAIGKAGTTVPWGEQDFILGSIWVLIKISLSPQGKYGSRLSAFSGLHEINRNGIPILRSHGWGPVRRNQGTGANEGKVKGGTPQGI